MIKYIVHLHLHFKDFCKQAPGFRLYTLPLCVSVLGNIRKYGESLPVCARKKACRKTHFCGATLSLFFLNIHWKT